MINVNVYICSDNEYDTLVVGSLHSFKKTNTTQYNTDKEHCLEVRSLHTEF